MWFEFADDTSMFTLESQFMLGDYMLVAPKVTVPSAELDEGQMQEVTYTLPSSASWYNYYTKEQQSTTGQAITQLFSDLEQAVFIKGGAIMPVLLHDDCMAISKCIFDKIRLDVYLDSNGQASGSLYTDDGVSFEHTDGAFAEVSFTYDGSLKSSRVGGDSTKYSIPKSQTIDQVFVHGFSEMPNAILQNGQQVPDYFFQKGSLMIAMPGSTAPHEVNLEFVFN